MFTPNEKLLKNVWHLDHLTEGLKMTNPLVCMNVYFPHLKHTDKWTRQVMSYSKKLIKYNKAKEQNSIHFIAFFLIYL